MQRSDLALPRGSLVLVTGSNGYIASHIVDHLLQLGYRVRGTIRQPKPWLNEYFTDKYGEGKFETAIVPKIDVVGAFKEPLKGVDGIIHAASDVSFSDDPDSVIPTMVAATENLLDAAAKEKSVRRFVLTSSSAAAFIPFPDKEVVVDTGTWNDYAIQAARDKNTPAELKGGMLHCASKTEAERTAWKFMEEKRPGFVLNTILPDVNLGRILHPQIAGSSMALTRALLQGNSGVMNMLWTQWYVDVQDNAKLHVIALLGIEVKSERIFAFADIYTWTQIIELMHKILPEDRCRQLVSPPENEGRALGKIIPAKRAEELLLSFYGKVWTKLATSLAEGL